MEDHVTPLKTGIKYGGYLGAIMIVLSLVTHYGELQDMQNPWNTSGIIIMVLTYGLTFLLTFLGIKYYKSNNEDLLTLGEGVSVGLFIGLFSGLIGAIFMYIFVAYIDPSIGEQIIDSVDMDEMSADQAEATKEAMGFATSPIFLAFSSFIGSIIGGLIWGLIASLFLKKE